MTNYISKDELKRKIERGDRFRLCMALNEWHFEAARIPGSVLIPSKAVMMSILRPEEEIVVYCSDDSCFSSRLAVETLERAGYRNVWHYRGGLRKWMDAGYPLEGTMAR